MVGDVLVGAVVGVVLVAGATLAGVLASAVAGAVAASSAVALDAAAPSGGGAGSDGFAALEALCLSAASRDPVLISTSAVPIAPVAGVSGLDPPQPIAGGARCSTQSTRSRAALICFLASQPFARWTPQIGNLRVCYVCVCVLKRNGARSRVPTTARTQPQMGGGVDPVSAREQAESARTCTSSATAGRQNTCVTRMHDASKQARHHATIHRHAPTYRRTPTT